MCLNRSEYRKNSREIFHETVLVKKKSIQGGQEKNGEVVGLKPSLSLSAASRSR